MLISEKLHVKRILYIDIQNVNVMFAYPFL